MISKAILTAFCIEAAVAAASSPSITWSECPSGIPPGVDCGSIQVPLAYEPGNSTAASGSGTVTLVLTRLNATGNNTQGPLFFNPGGPGVSASLLVAAGNFVPNFGFNKNVTEAYDIIGLDPRGVGFSSPVKCDPDIFNERVPTFVNSSDSYKALVDHSRRFGESCANLTGPLLNHLDSVHVAKDHEAVRHALGADKFNYLGISYGSVIGSTYLSLFPHNIGRMALDGLVDHSQSEVSTLLTESTTYETTLNKFFEWCDNNSTCAIHANKTSKRADTGTQGSSKKAFDALLTQADKSPIPAPGCNGTCQPNVTREDILYNTQSYLQFFNLSYTANWQELAGGIAEASNGNATALSTPLALSQNATSMEGSPFGYLAIGCQDWLHRSKSAQDIEQRRDAVKLFAPQTAGASQTYYYQSMCLGWPAPVTYGQAPFNTTVTGQAPPILLSNSVYDPSCSIVWANGLRQQLPSAVSITRNGVGHTSHFLLGETRNVIDNYLATGELPKDGSVYAT